MQVAVRPAVAHSRHRMLPANHSRRAVPPVALAALLALLAGPPLARAQGPELSAIGAAVATGSDLLETTIAVERLVPAAHPDRGSGRFVQADRLAAGDELHYTIRVRNPGARFVTDVQVVKRMPDGVQYIEGSAVGPACDVEFSADGGQTFTVKAPAGGFTHLRWSLRRPLPPGATALLRFRATFR
jgi:uncharacterized repeat protein (TIGR01451 family)